MSHIAIDMGTQTTNDVSTQTDFITTKKHNKALEVVVLTTLTFAIETYVFHTLQNFENISPSYNAIVPTVGYIVSQIPIIFLANRIFDCFRK